MSSHCVAGMSRGSVDENRGRLMQLAEAAGSKRRSYSSQHTLFKSLQQMTPSPCIATKLLSLDEVVRNDPSYTPNIEHLVFPPRKATSGKTGARAKLAEVFSLSRHQSTRNKEREKSRGSQRKSNKVCSLDLRHIQIVCTAGF